MCLLDIVLGLNPEPEKERRNGKCSRHNYRMCRACYGFWLLYKSNLIHKITLCLTKEMILHNICVLNKSFYLKSFMLGLRSDPIYYCMSSCIACCSSLIFEMRMVLSPVAWARKSQTCDSFFCPCSLHQIGLPPCTTSCL